MRTARGVLALAVLAIACACGSDAPIAAVDVAISVRAAPLEVEFGRAFPLTVVRVWRDDLTPDAWDDTALAPLGVRLVDVTRRERAQHVEETRRFDAYAFQRTKLTVPPVAFRVRAADGGAVQIASSSATTLVVAGALGAAPTTRPMTQGADAWPGPAELPGDPLLEPVGWRGLAGGSGVVIALAALAWWLRRRARRAALAPAAAAPTVDPSAEALARAQARAHRRLAALGVPTSETAEAVEAWYVEASSLVRDFLQEAFALPTLELTTEECLASAATAHALTAAQRALLTGLLPPCDLVKFARAHPRAADRAALLTAAAAFVDGAARASQLEPAA